MKIWTTSRWTFSLAWGAIISLITFSQLPAEVSNFDGPAELPRLHVNSALADTPSPGRLLTVKEGENLQKTLDEASCGDRIELQAGAAFRGQFKIPLKNCDDAHWIVIRTAAQDSELPPEGTRIQPCLAGVEMLPGRPGFHCTSHKNVLAKIAYTGVNGSGPIVISDGANHYRLLGLEITRESPGSSISNLVSLGSRVHHIVFDRIWMHGTAQDETARGIFLGESNNIAIVDSFFSDFHCTAVTGACLDSQAIAGGLGDKPMGPYKVVNNFLEAAGENILFGGGAASATPADIEIRHNYFYKAPNWHPDHPQFVGAVNRHPFIVKNLLELKNAQRVLIEGNVFENSWGGFSQTGFAVLLTPKNQGYNSCPVCQVTDVTMRYCKISHVGSGFQIANAPSDKGSAAQAGARYSIHDIVVDDIGALANKGFGTLAQISSETPILHDVSLHNITAFPAKSLLLIGAPPGRKMYAFSFAKNLVTAGEHALTSTGGGPLKTCSAEPDRRSPTDILKDCFSSYFFTGNAIIGGGSGWPPGNISLHVTEAGFVNYNGGNGGDYRQLRDNRLESKAKGKHFGANIEAVDAATAGVK